ALLEGPAEAPPRRAGRGEELQVVNVSVGSRARRRLERQAGAARIGLLADALVLDDCVEVDGQVQSTVPSVAEDLGLVSSDEEASQGSGIGVAIVAVEEEGVEDIQDSPSFYEDADASPCCSACREFFLAGQLRLGFVVRAGEPSWVHAPRCFRRANFEVHLAETIAFAADLDDTSRAHVLEELAAVNARQSEPRWPGQTHRVAPNSTQPWQCTNPRPDVVGWTVVHVPSAVAQSRPGSRPLLAALSARSNLHAALEARWAMIDSRLAQADRLMTSIDGEQVSEHDEPLHRTRRGEGSAADVASLLACVPSWLLSVDEKEPCAVCYEPMVSGEEARRLPCLHLFHRECIERWVSVKATCPLDNLKLRDLLSQQEALPAAGPPD
ncbi:unnamed protein product, partial [Polarella glacialis]